MSTLSQKEEEREEGTGIDPVILASKVRAGAEF